METFYVGKWVQKYTTKTDTCNKYMLESDFINILIWIFY